MQFHVMLVYLFVTGCGTWNNLVSSVFFSWKITFLFNYFLIMKISYGFRCLRCCAYGLSWGCAYQVRTFSRRVLACWWSCSNAQKVPGNRVIHLPSTYPLNCSVFIFHICYWWLQGLELGIDNFDIQTVKLAGSSTCYI